MSRGGPACAASAGAKEEQNPHPRHRHLVKSQGSPNSESARTVVRLKLNIRGTRTHVHTTKTFSVVFRLLVLLLRLPIAILLEQCVSENNCVRLPHAAYPRPLPPARGFWGDSRHLNLSAAAKCFPPLPAGGRCSRPAPRHGQSQEEKRCRRRGRARGGGRGRRGRAPAAGEWTHGAHTSRTLKLNFKNPNGNCPYLHCSCALSI